MFHVTLWKLEHSILWPNRILKLSRDTWLNSSLTIMIMQVLDKLDYVSYSSFNTRKKGLATNYRLNVIYKH